MVNAQTLPWLILGGVALLFCLVYIRAFVTWIGGTWYERKDEKSPIQEIKLNQIGPFVWGSAKVDGGMLHFRGMFNGKVLHMKRRDFGRDYLSKIGFPKEVLRDLDGSEMAKMTFTFNPTQARLQGEHFPQKIEISRTRPPKILERGYLPPVPRTWYRSRKAAEQRAA